MTTPFHFELDPASRLDQIVKAIAEASVTFDDVREVGAICSPRFSTGCSLANRTADRDLAIEPFERVAELRPDNADPQNDYAWTLVTAGRGRTRRCAPRRRVDETAKRAFSTHLRMLSTPPGIGRKPSRPGTRFLAIDAYYYRPPRNQFCEKDQALLEEARRRLRGEA